MDKVVYRGSEYETDQAKDVPVFFSSSEDFAKDYGNVRMYAIQLKKPFDTCLKEDVETLLSFIGTLTDPYSSSYFTTYQKLDESGLLYHDTWEIFEPFMQTIERLGYDGMIIYEGGVQNFVTFYQQQYKQI